MIPRHSVTQLSWIEDFRGLLDGVLHGGQEDAQFARLRDLIDVSYSSDIRDHLFQALKHSYLWVTRNWNYFEEIGMVGRDEDGRITMTNSLMYSLHHIVYEMPDELMEKVPQLDPAILVPVAQGYIDADREQQPEAPE